MPVNKKNAKINAHEGYSIILIILTGIMLLFIPGVIPIFGPFIAGLVIGYLAKDIKRGIIAGATAAIIFTLIVWIIISIFMYPYIIANHIKIFGAFTGISILSIIGSLIGLYEIFLVVIGAIVGGALGDKSAN